MSRSVERSGAGGCWRGRAHGRIVAGFWGADWAGPELRRPTVGMPAGAGAALAAAPVAPAAAAPRTSGTGGGASTVAARTWSARWPDKDVCCAPVFGCAARQSAAWGFAQTSTCWLRRLWGGRSWENSRPGVRGRPGTGYLEPRFTDWCWRACLLPNWPCAARSCLCLCRINLGSLIARCRHNSSEVVFGLGEAGERSRSG